MDFAEWTAIAAVITLLILVGGVLVRLIDRINKSEAAATAATVAATAAALNKLELERLEHDLVEHRVAVAKDYASKEAMRDSESRILSAIGDLGKRIDMIFHHQRPAE